MKTVVVVDDEKTILDGIAHLVEESGDFKVLAKYRNGREALVGCKKRCPDIIITDVKMPVSDGLTLVEEGQKCLDAQYIVISGYEEFEYARRAATLHVSEYLLKPVDIQQLRNALLTVATRLDMASTERSLLRRQLGMLCAQQSACIPDELALVLAEKLGIQMTEVICAALFLPGVPRPADKLLEKLCRAFEELQDEKGCKNYALCVWDQHIYLFLFAPDPQAERLCAMVCQFQQCAVALHGHSMYAGISRSFQMPCDCVRAAQQALVCAHAFLYQPGETIFRFSACWDYQEDPECYLALPRRKILALAEAKDFIGIKHTIQSFLNTCQTSDYNPSLFFSLLRSSAEQCSAELNLPLPQKTALLAIVDHLYFAETDFNMALALLEQISLDLAQMLAAQDGTALVKKVTDYVGIHYGQRLALSDISDKFYINASYFCKIFKRETGLTFNDYLTRLRIRKAKQFIRSGNYKIYEISQLCGFKDPKYFAQTFRKMIGISPTQYASRFGGPPSDTKVEHTGPPYEAIPSGHTHSV